MSSRPCTRFALALAVLLGTCIGCGSHVVTPAPSAFPVTFSAVTDENEPLADVSFVVSGGAPVTTLAGGRFDKDVAGAEGQTLGVTVTCPAGYALDEKPAPLRLSRTRKLGAESEEPVSYRVTCARRARNVVVVVRAGGGGSLPIHIDGEPVGVTGEDGTAHFALDRDRDVRSLNVSLDTGGRPELRPANPSRTFDLAGRDAIVLVDQNFVTVVRNRALPRVGAPPPRHVPYRID